MATIKTSNFLCYLTAQRMLITYTSIVHMIQAGFLRTNTVNLTHLYRYMLNREK